MRPRRPSEVMRAEGYEIRIVGAPRGGLRDLYHWLLAVPGWATLAIIVGVYLALNVVFALAFLAVGGVANLPPGSFADAFFFSVQPMVPIVWTLKKNASAKEPGGRFATPPTARKASAKTTFSAR